MFKKVKRVGHVETFTATKEMEIGDMLTLYVTSNDRGYPRGVYAFAKVIKERYLLDDPSDTLNDTYVVDGEIIHIDYKEPYIKFNRYKKMVNGNFRTPNKINESYYKEINEKIEKIDKFNELLEENKIQESEEIEENDEKSNENKKAEIIIDNGEGEITHLLEGKKYKKEVNVYKRSKEIRDKVVELHGTTCEVCGFDFEKTYGWWGKDYIEVHHIDPISQWEGEKEPDIEKDFAVLCANCHRMIHRRHDETLSIEELKMKILLKL